MAKFQPGEDARRTRALQSPRNGRPPSAASLSKIVRTRFSVARAEQIVDRILTLAEAGDPDATCAAATLLGAVLGGESPKVAP